MTNWKISFFSNTVKGVLEKWSNKLKAKFTRVVELIAISSPMEVGMPHVKSMGEGLFEIRVKSEEGIGSAFFCMIIGKEVIILHLFIKKTQKTPEKELSIARKRMKKVLKDG